MLTCWDCGMHGWLSMAPQLLLVNVDSVPSLQKLQEVIAKWWNMMAKCTTRNGARAFMLQTMPG